jgi:CRISPR system Cascade subunit CasA
MENRTRSTFNLIDEHWIPCVRADGTMDTVGLRDALTQAHLLRRAHGDTPLETAALLRLLITLSHRVFPVRNQRDWLKFWHLHDGFDAAAIDQYFAEWRRCFDLFDAERPFLQAAHPKAPEKTINNLMLHMASGGNATLFDHHTDEEALTLSPAQAARALITVHSFGIGGLSGAAENFTDAPCAKGVLFFIEGDSLFETLLLNMVGSAISSKYRSNDEEENLPYWEQNDPFRPDRDIPLSYLDYLTWPNRRIRLRSVETDDGVRVDRMWWYPGLRLSSSVRDPFKCYLHSKDKTAEPYPRAFQSDRALWRDSEAFLNLRNGRAEVPRIMEWLQSLLQEGLPANRTLRVLALGMAKDKAKVEFLRAEHLPLPLAYLQQDTLIEHLAQAIHRGERAAIALKDGITGMASRYLKPAADENTLTKDDREAIRKFSDGWRATDRYWSKLDMCFAELMHGLADTSQQNRNEAAERWRIQIENAAREAFAYAEDRLGDDVRSVRARALGRNTFERRLHWELSKQPGAADSAADSTAVLKETLNDE